MSIIWWWCICCTYQPNQTKHAHHLYIEIYEWCEPEINLTSAKWNKISIFDREKRKKNQSIFNEAKK